MSSPVPRRRSRWTRSCSRSRARSRRWTASSTTARDASSATTATAITSTAPPSSCGRACRWASSARCSAPPWPSWSSSPAPLPPRLPSPAPHWRSMADLEIRNLHVAAGDKQILKGVDLRVRSGEIHAMMGPNGSGKSTLANAIMGHPGLEVTEGEILFDGEEITEADPDERARAGLFMAFQYPVAIPGVTTAKYLRMVMNAHREARGESPVSLKDFRKTVEAAMELTNVPKEFSSRYIND